MTTRPESETASEKPDRGRIVGAIAARLRNVDAFGTGSLAELRRLDPFGPLSEPALHRLLARHEVPESWLAGSGLRRWALVIHALALAAPDQLWPETRLGRSLFEAGLSERRFVVLLEAGSHEMLDVLPRVVRFLVARGRPLNPFAVVDLVMSADAPDEGWGAAIRQRVAQDYFRTEFRAENPQPNTSQGDAP